MGEYRDGKWTPTFGDEQFGVVDQPLRNTLTNRFAESNADALRVIELAKENKRLINVVVTHEAEIERLQKALARSCEDARNEMYDCGLNAANAEIELLRAVVAAVKEAIAKQKHDSNYRGDFLMDIEAALKGINAYPNTLRDLGKGGDDESI